MEEESRTSHPKLFYGQQLIDAFIYGRRSIKKENGDMRTISSIHINSFSICFIFRPQRKVTNRIRLAGTRPTHQRTYSDRFFREKIYWAISILMLAEKEKKIIGTLADLPYDKPFHGASIRYSGGCVWYAISLYKY